MTPKEEATSRLAEEILDRAGKETIKSGTRRPFWRKKRYWFLACACLAFYCCYLRPIEIDPTAIAELNLDPAFEDEMSPNFRKRFDDWQDREFAPASENGFRLLLRALGPRVLNKKDWARHIPWESFPTDEKTGAWFREEWTPLCRKFELDPCARPTLIDSPDLVDVVGEETVREISARRWTSEDFPNAARWLDESAPLFAIFEEAIEKPKFGAWLLVGDGPEAWIKATAPDVAVHKEIATLLAVRANYRLGRGDIDGALEDERRVFRLARFLLIRGEPFLLCEIVGLRIVDLGIEKINIAGNPRFRPTSAQLEREKKIQEEALGDLDLDASFQRALNGEREGYFASAVDFVASPEARLRFAELAFNEFDLERDPRDASLSERAMTKIARVSAFGLDANVFIRRLDDYWRRPELLDEFPKGNLEVLIGANSPRRKTRSEFFAGFYALSFLPAFESARRQLERTKDLVRESLEKEKFEPLMENQ